MLTGQDLLNCQARIEERLNNGDSVGVWDIVRNNENVASRKHVRTLDANAPAHSAAMKDWRYYVAARFPDFEAKMEAKKAAYEEERKTRELNWEKNSCESMATCGNSWKRKETVYKNSLEFVKALYAEGFQPVNMGRGLMEFHNTEGDLRVGGFRNAHINSAVRFLELCS